VVHFFENLKVQKIRANRAGKLLDCDFLWSNRRISFNQFKLQQFHCKEVTAPCMCRCMCICCSESGMNLTGVLDKYFLCFNIILLLKKKSIICDQCPRTQIHIHLMYIDSLLWVQDYVLKSLSNTVYGTVAF